MVLKEMKIKALFHVAIVLLSSVAQCKNVLVDSLPAVPDGWTKIRDVNGDKPIKLRIALEQPNLENFERILYSVSTPQHPLYGQHLSRESVKELVKPVEESTTAVLNWLRSAGIHEGDIEDDGDWINFRTTISKAAEMLNTTFGVYKYAGATKQSIRTLHYSVPEEVKSHITMIQPTTRFGQIGPQRIQSSHTTEQRDIHDTPSLIREAGVVSPNVLNVTFCNTTIVPACLRALYRMNETGADPDAPGSFGIAGFLEGYAKHVSLDAFLEVLAPYAVSQNFTTISVNGGLDNQTDFDDNDIEANLDVQYAASMGWGQKINFYSVGGRGPLVPDLDEPNPNDVTNEPYLELITYLIGLPDKEIPHTLTISYGEDEQSLPQEYAKRVCNMFGQLGLRGVSILASSGDVGPGSACQTNDDKNTTRFMPMFPASCPYLTSVGATEFVLPERAAPFSSGGFSDVFPRAGYQEPYVSNYLKSIGDTFKGLYNASGRGFPDISAQGSSFVFADQGTVGQTSGTSASAPTFAGIIALLNNARLSKGQQPFGFLNPWLYQFAQAHDSPFTDIVHGGSRGCIGRSIYSGLPTPKVPGAGWNATKGWDPVTGLGTPLFDKLMAKLTMNDTIRRTF